MSPVAVRKITRADPEVIERLASAGVATAHEAMGRLHLMQPYLRPIIDGLSIGGSAITVLAQPGDNWMLHVGLELAKPGDVLVVGLTTPNTDGMFGDLMGSSALAIGIKALIIDAGCRDIKALREMGFPVWSRAVSARGTVKETLGAVNVPIVCAGEIVNPGDVIVADDDGVAVVPRSLAATIADGAESRMREEDALRERMKKGELGLDIANLRGKLVERGFRYIDSLDDL